MIEPSTNVETYQLLNNSFKRKLVFRLGADAGFFSEYNNMILMQLYCLKHNIRFILNSSFANFRYSNGWTDYFKPFCDESTSWFHEEFNVRPYMINGRKKLYGGRILKRIYLVDYLTQDLFGKIREREFGKELFDIKEMGIHSDLLGASKTLINDLTWHYNEDTQNWIDGQISSLRLPAEYISMHIRGGDKFLENELIGSDRYIEIAERISGCRNVFILTDDFSIIENVRKHFPEWTVYTFCTEEEKGYYLGEFLLQDKDYQKKKLLNLFASTDIMANSIRFIGTFSSNVGMFMGMRMGIEKCIGVDRPDWLIW